MGDEIKEVRQRVVWCDKENEGAVMENKHW